MGERERQHCPKGKCDAVDDSRVVCVPYPESLRRFTSCAVRGLCPPGCFDLRAMAQDDVVVVEYEGGWGRLVDESM